MKKLLFILIISVSVSVMIQAQYIGISIEEVSTNGYSIGDTILVDVRCNEIIYNPPNYTASGQLMVTYDPVVLTAVSASFGNYHTNLNSYFINNNAIVLSAIVSPGDWRLIFFSGNSPGIIITAPSVMLSIPFIWNGGSSSLVWDTATNIHPLTFLPGYPKDGYVGTISSTVPYDLETENIIIWSNKKTIYIKFPEPNKGKILVYNLLGKEIERRDLALGMNLILIEGSNSYYLVKVITESNIVTSKVYIDNSN